MTQEDMEQTGYYWSRLVNVLGLTTFEQYAERFYPIGHGRSQGGHPVHMFLFPQQRSLVRLEIETNKTHKHTYYDDQQIHMNTHQVDLSVCNSHGVTGIFVDGMKWWYRSAFPWDAESWVKTYTNQTIVTMGNGFPPPWTLYQMVNVFPPLDSLFEYQLFTNDNVFVRASKDAASMIDDWLTTCHESGRILKPELCAWSFHGDRYIHERTKDIILRLRTENMGEIIC